MNKPIPFLAITFLYSYLTLEGNEVRWLPESMKTNAVENSQNKKDKLNSVIVTVSHT